MPDEPVFTDIYDRVDSFVPIQDSAYLFAQSVEERSEHSLGWLSTRPDVKPVRVLRQDPTVIEVAIESESRTFSLRSERQLQDLWNWISRRDVYIDITGLSHHAWAGLLRSSLRCVGNVMVVYVEPADYTFSSTPTEGQIFDLSERISGIAPLPGFASLADTRDPEFIFVPLLGFEGTRLAYVIEQVQPSNDRIIPVIGVPGFRPEYPFHTYMGNRRALVETGAWHRVEYVTANCPFSVFFLLRRLARENPSSVLRVAPIGTKPHALGSVLYKILSVDSVELVYDHPIRKPKRTRGHDHLLVYHVSPLLEALVQAA